MLKNISIQFSHVGNNVIWRRCKLKTLNNKIKRNNTRQLYVKEKKDLMITKIHMLWIYEKINKGKPNFDDLLCKQHSLMLHNSYINVKIAS